DENAATFEPVPRSLSHPRPDAFPSQFTAEVVGLPELRVTADTREAAIEQVQAMLDQRLTSGELILVSPTGNGEVLQSRHRFAGHAKDDPDFDHYLEEIRRFREQADQQQCSNSSSTPTG